MKTVTLLFAANIDNCQSNLSPAFASTVLGGQLVN